MVRACRAVTRSTSCTICPRFNSGTTNDFTYFESLRRRSSGKGQAEINRNLPVRTPRSRAIRTARSATAM
jgi:hypothetical protein